MRNILKEIFSIQDYGVTHRIMYIFGIKLKFPKAEFAKKKKESPYYYYKKNNVDITTLPPATGQLREIQLANLELLKEFDYVCKQNGLKYWLDFGTLLGAVRHKGFIPWDDDIDVGMMREDYDKIIEAFQKSSRNPDVYAEYYQDERFPCIVIMKVKHKKHSHLFVDIFPYEYCDVELSQEEISRFKGIFKSAQKKAEKVCQITSKIEKTIKILDEIREKYIYKDREKNVKNRQIIYGDYNHTSGSFIYSPNNFFPLKEIEFEKIEFPCPQKSEIILRDIYGDYMNYPKKIGFGHNFIRRINEFS